MFDEINRSAIYRKKHLVAPLLEERLQYLQYLKARGRSLSTIKSVADYLLRIIEFLRLDTKRTVTLKEIETAANIWARYNQPQKRQLFSVNSKEHFTRCATEWLKLIGWLARPCDNVALFYKIFKRRYTLNRHSTAPLLKERMKYLQYWDENGATIASLREISSYLLRVIEYINLKHKKIVTIAEIKAAANKWAHYQSTNPRKWNDYSDSAKRCFISHAFNWLKMIGYLRLPAEKPQPFSIYLHKYIEYMRYERGFSEETIRGRIHLLKNFLTLIWGKTHHFKKLTILIIDEIFSSKRNSNKYSRRSIQSYASVTRSFLKYAEQKTWCQNGLANAIEIARTYKHETLPYSPSWDDVKRMVAGTEGDNPTNIRDRAILLLLSVYGLRRIEVVKLTLDDIDWQKEQIRLNRAKNGKPQTFPLSATVGEAILRYIKEVRPNNNTSRNIFICRKAPLRPLAAAAITAIVSTRWKPLDVKIKHHGAHALRHACATHLINKGVTLKEISSHLGHNDMEATRIYAKVDLVNLRKVADFNLGDLL